LFRSAPCRTHAKTRRAMFPCRARCCDHFINRQNALIFNAGVIPRRLRAIPAIFGATAGLDRQQCRQLHGVRVEMRAMHLLRTEQQIVERQREQRFDGSHRPAPDVGRSLALFVEVNGSQGIHGFGLDFLIRFKNINKNKYL
jgi:hypothetical protein